jgi:hypothetical protein
MIAASSFAEGLPILDIIKAGAGGLAVLVALLAYRITRDVVKWNGLRFNALEVSVVFDCVTDENTVR